MTKTVIAVCSVLLVWALAQAPMVLDLLAYKVTQVEEAGKQVEKFQLALGGKPGEVLEYRLEASNVTEKELRQLELVIPIPRETSYQNQSAQPLMLGDLSIRPEFSFDGGARYGFPPLKKKVKVIENGKEVDKEVEVKPEEYTHARWVLPVLSPKQKQQLKLRVAVR
jgi:hypothetical protein